MRRVKVFDSKHVHIKNGWFHRFGCGYKELKDGLGIHTQAIIEFDDGTIENISFGLMQFIDKPDEKRCGFCGEQHDKQRKTLVEASDVDLLFDKGKTLKPADFKVSTAGLRHSSEMVNAWSNIDYHKYMD